MRRDTGARLTMVQAVKEFSKSRLRKRAQSNLLRRPKVLGRVTTHTAANQGFNSPLHRHGSSDDVEDHAFDLIKEEIAVMKKLNHPNVVSLIEVLDDPDEDSLYMVLEMCKKGVVMNVGLDNKADPYDDETCRSYFRDMILGMEYCLCTSLTCIASVLTIRRSACSGYNTPRHQTG